MSTENSAIPCRDGCPENLMTGCVVNELATCCHRCQGLRTIENSLVQRVIVECVGGNVCPGTVVFQEAITECFHVVEHVCHQLALSPLAPKAEIDARRNVTIRLTAIGFRCIAAFLFLSS